MQTQIFAHRGANYKFPENTMPAFKHALKEKADGIELDVQLSKDGIPVVIHDEKVNRTTNGVGYVKDLTVSELQALRAGTRKWWRLYHNTTIPTLEEVLKWIGPTSMRLNIELKNSGFAYEGLTPSVLDLVNQFNMMERTVFSSFNHDSLYHLQQMAPEANTALLYRKPMPEPWTYTKALNASGIHPHRRNITPGLIKQMHKYQFAVRAYTINQPRTMRQMMDWEIDAIITDVPAVADKVRRQYKP